MKQTIEITDQERMMIMIALRKNCSILLREKDQEINRLINKLAGATKVTVTKG